MSWHPDPQFTTAQIAAPSRTMDQVIGQDSAVALAHLAARQGRSLFLMGEPGTGKSLIGRSLAELLPEVQEGKVTLAISNPLNPMCPMIETLSPSDWESRCTQSSLLNEAQMRTRRILVTALGVAGVLGGLVYAYHQKALVTYGLALLPSLFLLAVTRRHFRHDAKHFSRARPKVLLQTGRKRPFVDATGLSAGALLGDVRHDPYQSGGPETASHHLVEAGAIHRAHGGILYIDEIATLSEEDQCLLLTAFQDKSLPITGRSGASSGALVQTAPVPCDFVLVAAGHEDDLAKLLPALRSRIRGTGYEVLTRSSMPDTPENRAAIVRFIAQEVVKDGRIPHFDQTGIQAVWNVARDAAGEDHHLTLRLRELGGLIRMAGDFATRDAASLVQEVHVKEAYEATLVWGTFGLTPRSAPKSRVTDQSISQDSDATKRPGTKKISVRQLQIEVAPV